MHGCVLAASNPASAQGDIASASKHEQPNTAPMARELTPYGRTDGSPGEVESLKVVRPDGLDVVRCHEKGFKRVKPTCGHRSPNTLFFPHTAFPEGKGYTKAICRNGSAMAQIVSNNAFTQAFCARGIGQKHLRKAGVPLCALEKQALLPQQP